MFKEAGVKPSAYLNQSIEVIATNFKNQRIDGATVWEPVASRLVNQGLAKRVASGVNFDEKDAGFLVVSKELLDSRPDVVEAYLMAELEAQQWVADPANAMELSKLAADQTEGYTVADMWDAMFEGEPVGKDGQTEAVSNRMPFIVDEQAQEHVERSWTFLHQAKVIAHPEPFVGIVQDDLARRVLAESGAEFPAVVKSLPKSEFKG